jgi:hypothetical protein
MSAIEFEDRTTETPEAATWREITAASHAIMGTTIVVSRGNPAVGLGALALALGKGAARAGASLEEVTQAMKDAYDEMMQELSEQASTRSDA